jgi:hypothetical protein
MDGIGLMKNLKCNYLKILIFASSVAVGVPVDNTTGTAIISVTDMGSLLASYNV